MRPFLNQAADTKTVDLGQPLQIPCPPHGYSPLAIYTWQSEKTEIFPKDAHIAITPDGELVIMYVTAKDIDDIDQLKGIACTITGANTYYQGGLVTLQARQQGKELLYYILYYVLQLGAVGCALSIQVQALAEVFVFHLCFWESSLS